MTQLQRLQTITLEDEFINILFRMVDFSSVPQDETRYVISEDETLSMYKRTTLHASLIKPTLTKMKAELEVWRTEAIAQEETRLAEIARLKDLKDRFENLNDMRAAYDTLHSDKPNPAVFLRDELLGNKDKTEAEQLMKDLEVKDTELKTQIDDNAWSNNRLSRYEKETDHLFKEAVREKLLGDSAKWDIYIAIIDGIKSDNQKPI